MNPKTLKLLIAAVVFTICIALMKESRAYNHNAPYNKRIWGYYNMTCMLSPEWGIMLQPGMLYEYYNSSGEARDIVLEELFAGPIYIRHISNNLQFVFAFGYYYIGFPRRDYKDTDDDGRGDQDVFWYSHNFEAVPDISYTMDRFKISAKAIFHSKYYARNDVYKTEDDRWGFSMLMRDMIKIAYSVSKDITISGAGEIYVGLIEDKKTSSKYKALDAKGEPYFERQGFLRNRLYCGIDMALSPVLKLSPNYVLESAYNPDKDGILAGRNHIITVTLSYVARMWD